MSLKKIALPVFVGVGMVAGCSRSQRQEPVSAAPPLIDSAVYRILADTTKYSIELNLEKGKTYKLLSDTKGTVYQTIEAKTATTELANVVQTAYKVLDVKENRFILEVRYLLMSVTMVTPQGIKHYGTENALQNDVLSVALKSLKNRPFRVVVDKMGKVVELSGLDPIIRQVGQQLAGDNIAKQKLFGEFAQNFGEKGFRYGFEKCFAVLPPGPTRLARSWPVSHTSGPVLTPKFNGSFQLHAVNDSIITVKGKADLSPENKDALIQTGELSLKYDMSGTVASEIKIDRKTGWVRSAVHKQKLSGTNDIFLAELNEHLSVPTIMQTEETVSDR